MKKLMDNVNNSNMNDAISIKFNSFIKEISIVKKPAEWTDF